MMFLETGRKAGKWSRTKERMKQFIDTLEPDNYVICTLKDYIED